MCLSCNERERKNCKERGMKSQGSMFQRIGRESEGSSFVELAIVLPLFLLMFVPAMDIGRALYAAIEVS